MGNKKEYSILVENQRKFFRTGKTLDYSFRVQQLKKLQALIEQNESRFLDALYADLHINTFEGHGLQTGLIINEVSYILRNLKSWMKPEKKITPLFHFYSKSSVLHQPFGVSLIIAPWNFPLQLALRPTIGAMAAGNTCIVAPSEITTHTLNLLAEIINTNFDAEYLHVIKADAIEKALLTEENFDFIFFTGGTKVGKLIYAAAAKNLTPVALELGGKSPCIVDKNIPIEVAARRITWGKFCNAGQICITPDYVLVHADIKERFISEVIKNIRIFYGDNAKLSADYGRIVNEAHFNRIAKLIQNTSILFGGEMDATEKYISPTLVEINDLNHPLMNEEIFGPIMPILTYTSQEEIIEIIQKNPDPLALYVYSKNKLLIHKLQTEVSSGDMCVNENVLHFGQLHLPIGGIRNSGMGKYQGKNTFEAFSHKKSLLQKSFAVDIPIRYPPYSIKKIKWLRILLKWFY